MNKKLFSRLLWGVLVVASFGMIASCSDYDDDISDLRNQITTTATDLKSLVEEKSSNAEKEIGALKSQLSALEDAYKTADSRLDEAIKNATNDAKGYADIQAAEAQKAAIAAAQKMVEDAVAALQNGLDAANQKIDEQGKTVQSLLAADAALQNGIDAAQARAEQAYTLAEQSKTLAEANKEQLTKIAGDLEVINTTLTNLQKELNVLGENIDKVKKAAEANAAKITAQETALNDLKKSNEKAQEALAATDTELRKLIEANQTEIGKLETAVQEAKKAAADALTDAKSYTDTEVQKVKDLLENYGTVEGIEQKFTGINTKLGDLETAYKNADTALKNELKGEMTELENRVNGKIAEEIKKIDAKISSINSLLARLMTSNVNNLITSIIYQDRESYNVYAQVVGNPDGSNVETKNNLTIVHFPTKTNSKMTLDKGIYNVQAWSGYIYATVNPTDIDASKADINLENSKIEANPYYTLGKAEVAKGHLITMTRDAKGLNSKNGLWRIPVTSVTTRENPADHVDEAAYALYTSYKQDTLDVATDKVVTVEKKVYSHYAIGLNPKKASKATGLTLEGENTDKTSVTVDADNRILFSDLTGNILLGTNDVRVYKKYVECTEVRRNGAVVANGKKEFNTANSGVLEKVLDAANEGGVDTLALVCPENFTNYEIDLDYYIWNYDGSVEKISRTVVFNKVLWGPDKTTFSVTPDNGTSMTTYSTEFPNFAFVKGEKCKNGTTWKQEAVSVQATVESGSEAMNGAVIKLQSNDKAATYETVTVGATTDPHDMTVATLDKIKQMQIIVNPANLTPEKEYKVTLTFYNEIGAMVNQVNILYTLQIPTGKPKPWHIEAAFDSNDKLTIAWATPDVYDATNTKAHYDFSGSFYQVNNGFPTAGDPYYFEISDPANYAVNKPFHPFTPSAIPSHNGYKMSVPNAALNGVAGTEHTYDMKAGIQFFGLTNLISSHTKEGWADNFQIKFLSPIRYAILGTKGYITGKTYAGMTNKPISVDYRQSVIVDNHYFTAIDPKEATSTPVKFFENADARIVSTTLEFAEQNSNNALFSKIEKDANGTNGIYKLETSDKVSMTHDTDVKFKLTVTDVWGAKTEYVFPVTVKANR